jgi:putative ATPase
MPECDVALVQLAEYLANSKKSNAAYVAAGKAREDVQNFGNLPVPLHIRNAPTKLMKDLGYGAGYEYDHDLPSGKSNQQCMPDELKDREYFD